MSGWYTFYWNAFLLHVSVILFTRGGGLPHCKLGYTPSPGTRSRHPPMQSGVDPGFGQGGPQLLRPKVANIAKWSCASEASILRPGSRARLRALEAFGFLMLKYAFSHILETLFLLFLTSILTPKVDKNRALDFTSINLRHSDMLHLFFNLHEKVML